MNYLAHIHLAHVSDTSKLGNFLGDFAKGSRLENLPEDIQYGIRLHRSIDSYTDQHKKIISLREQFPASLRRMSGVVIDIYFDHLLCSHWSRFNDLPLPHTLAAFYQELQTRTVQVGGRFLAVKQGLLAHRWLEDYHHRESCTRAFYQIEKRLKGKVSFAQTADTFISQQHDAFEETFLLFYPELIQFVLTSTNTTDGMITQAE
jgi:acyl carrier protein phosphodiesterase